jgi:hypothetical protein
VVSAERKKIWAVTEVCNVVDLIRMSLEDEELEEELLLALELATEQEKRRKTRARKARHRGSEGCARIRAAILRIGEHFNWVSQGRSLLATLGFLLARWDRLQFLMDL